LLLKLARKIERVAQNSASLLRLARLVVEKWRKHGERFGADLRPMNIETDPASNFAEEV